MLQAWPVLGRTLCTAPGIKDAVFLPPASELSYSPLITNVGTFIVASRGVMSSPPRARKIWPMDSPESHGSRSTKVLSRYLPSFESAKSGRDQIAQMLNVIFFDADLGVAMNSLVDGAARAAAAADENDRFEHFRMIQAEQDGHARADADAAEDRFGHFFVPAHSENVVRHVFQAERRFRFVGTAVAANIDGDDFEVGGEMRDLVHPQIVIEGIGVDHDEGKPLAGNFVVDL